MDIVRPTRQSRKSPVNYFPESTARKARSRSRGRKKSVEPVSRKLNASDSVALEKPRRRSPSRNAKSPTRKKKMVTDEIEKSVNKNSSPVHSYKSKSNKFEELIRSSITPDRAKIEEAIRSSVSRFEEVIAEVAPSIKLRSKAKIEKSSVENERVEYIPALKKNEVNEKEIKTTTTSIKTSNNKNNNNNNQITIHENFQEFGGTVGVLLLMFFLPSALIIAHILCSQDKCASIPTKFTVSLQRFLDLDGSLWYLGFLLIQFFISAIPLGPRLYGTGSNGICLGYWRNGPASLILSILLLGAVKYYLDFPLVKLLDKSLPILVTAIFTSFVIAVLLYFVSLKENTVNLFANSGNLIHDMWAGREINPKIGPCDLKITLIRNSLLALIIINSCLVLKNLETNVSEYPIMLLLISTLQIIFAVDHLICESSLISSFIVTQEGTGFSLLMMLAVTPFWITLIPKQVYYLKPEYNFWIVLLSTSMYLLGHIIYRISSLQNDKFQRNPFLFKSSDVLYSRHSEKIFRGGLRWKIRYPEYSGLLLVIISWCVPSLYAEPLHWVPISQIFFAVLTCAIETKRLDNRSSIKHNHIWSSYASNTFAIIPYIF